MTRKHRTDDARGNSRNRVLIPAGIVGVIIVASVVALSAYSSPDLISRDSDSTPEQTWTPPSFSVASLVQEGAYVKGDPGAPVTLIEFADFQCPFCGRFSRQTAPIIDVEYIDTGKVNMIFKHFPLRGPDSTSASIAAQCAGEQSKFWEYHDVLYENQGAENSGWAGRDKLKEFASEIGLDRTAFDGCLDSNRYAQLIEDDLQFARDLKLTGTPTFVIAYSDGSEPQGLVGAQPADTFRKVLNDKLADLDA